MRQCGILGERSDFMKSRLFLVCIALFAAMLLLTGCYPGGGNYDAENPAGFFWGIWHGWISLFTLIGSVFSDYVTIYETYNTGFFYNLGFLIGVSSPIGSLSFFGRD